MNAKLTKKHYRSLKDVPKGRTDRARLKALAEKDVLYAAASDADAQPTDGGFWEDAEVILPEPKQAVSLRLDADVLAWFKAQGRGYQTRINAVLRSYMNAQRQN
jgi:uncharacterized protein (DUF4415 family)